jgi:biotin transport system permease protein
VYVHGESPLHRLSPGAKIAALLVTGTAIFFVRDPWALGGVMAAVLLLYRTAGLSLGVALRQLLPAAWLLAVLFVIQWAYYDVEAGLVMVLRFSALILLASLVSLTTRVSDMIDALMKACAPLAYVGVSPTRIGMVFSMAIRFIPVIAETFAEVREAQRVRGLERSMLAVAVPLIVRTLKMATEIGDAIDARSFDPDDAKPLRMPRLRRKTVNERSSS